MKSSSIFPGHVERRSPSLDPDLKAVVTRNGGDVVGAALEGIGGEVNGGVLWGEGEQELGEK